MPCPAEDSGEVEVFTFTLEVQVPAGTSKEEVKDRINTALDEGSWQKNDWGDWVVGWVEIED